MNDTNVGRRDVLKKVGLFGAGALAGSILMSKAAEAAGVKTPIQPEGPFYPVREQVDKDADMTKVLGRVTEAEGSQFVLSGKVVDASSGAVIPGAMVEFWQACATGRYNHPSDTNSAVLDPNFQYWSQVKTDNEGRFSIKTIVPGAYPASDDWIRPSHIHVKV
ncbi:MAG: twin-arginine translocation signal domain-containing protein, partial [Proteobacteria bacterium]|nr:twin-arginine translocation signal domain-containing protein [Pseudomonadota bacterium]